MSCLTNLDLHSEFRVASGVVGVDDNEIINNQSCNINLFSYPKNYICNWSFEDIEDDTITGYENYITTSLNDKIQYYTYDGKMFYEK